MSKKRVRGILDIVNLADGEEWELEPNSEDFVFGMGIGATEDATRWAYKGFCLEVGQSIRKIAAKNNGRPRKKHIKATTVEEHSLFGSMFKSIFLKNYALALLIVR